MSVMSTRTAVRSGLAVDEVRRLQSRGYRPRGYHEQTGRDDDDRDDSSWVNYRNAVSVTVRRKVSASGFGCGTVATDGQWPEHCRQTKDPHNGQQERP